MNVDARTAGDITRTVLGFVFGALVALGWANSTDALTIPSAVATLVVFIWPLIVPPPKVKPVILPSQEDNQ